MWRGRPGTRFLLSIVTASQSSQSSDSGDGLGPKKESASEEGHGGAGEQGERGYSLSQEVPQMFSDSGTSLLLHQCLLLIWKRPYSVLPLFLTVASVLKPLL